MNRITGLTSTLLIFGAAMVTSDGSALASDYCWIKGGPSLVNGGTTTEGIKVVVSSVARPSWVPTGRLGKEWCIAGRYSLGGNSSSRVIERPKLGAVEANSYWIAYRGDKVGRDRIVLERTWLGVRNEVYRGTLIYEIEVVPAAF